MLQGVLRGRGETSMVVWLGICSAAVLLLLAQGAITHIDGQTIYEVTKSMVTDRNFSVDPTQHLGGAVHAGDGQLYSKYGIGLSLLALIPYLLALPVTKVAGNADVLLEAAVSSLMPIICALLVVAVYLLARRLRGSVVASLVVAIGTVAGTFILAYTGEFFSEPPVALGLVVAIERALARRPGQAATALAAAALFRPQVFAFAPVLVLFLLQREGRASLRASIPPLAVAAVVSMLYNYARYRDPLESGYQANGEGFSFQLAGVHGLLLSADKSVFLFAPIVLLVPFALTWLWRRDRPAVVLIGLNVVITFLLAAFWTAWHGDWAWGPRLLLPAIPAALAALAPWLDVSLTRRRLVVGLLALGFALNISALIASTDAQQLDAAGHAPQSPGLTRQMEWVPSSVRYSLSHLGTGQSGDHRRYVDLWQFGLGRELGTKGLAAAVPISLLLLALAWGSGIAFRRRLGPLRD